jgi:hypothetical protein
MKYKVGTFYKTRAGNQAQIFILNTGDNYMLGARYFEHQSSSWLPMLWNLDGTHRDSSSHDLVSEWRSHIKYSVELWGNEWKPTPYSVGIAAQLLGPNYLTFQSKNEYCPIKYRITVEEIPE